MKKQIQELVRIYVSKNPVPQLVKEDLLGYPIEPHRRFADWYNPLGKIVREYFEVEEEKGYNLLHDEVNKLLGFKLARWDK